MGNKTAFGLLAAFFVSAASAGPFIEVGIGAQLGPVAQDNGCISDWDDKNRKPGCSGNPFGIAAIGWQQSGFSIQVEHSSSLQEKDKGLNVLSVRYRHDFFE